MHQKKRKKSNQGLHVNICATDQLFDGLCPACLMDNALQELWLNQGDVFECPHCHLQISLASGIRATVCRRRGHGEFKSLEDKYYCATRHAKGLLLVRESLTSLYEADGFNVFKTSDEFKDYLNEIKETD